LGRGLRRVVSAAGLGSGIGVGWSAPPDSYADARGCAVGVPMAWRGSAVSARGQPDGDSDWIPVLG
jgi:hypothetical protein